MLHHTLVVFLLDIQDIMEVHFELPSFVLDRLRSISFHCLSCKWLYLGPDPLVVICLKCTQYPIVSCHQTLFSCFFFSPFQPNFFTFLTNHPFFLMFIPLYFTLTTNNKEHSIIGIHRATYSQHWLLSDLVPETVHFLLNHILHWDSFCLFSSLYKEHNLLNPKR